MFGTMNRVNIFLSDKQLQAFAALSEKTGLKRAELVRRAIDTFLAKQQREERKAEKSEAA